MRPVIVIIVIVTLDLYITLNIIFGQKKKHMYTIVPITHAYKRRKKKIHRNQQF